MLSSPDSSMIEDLTVDELRWLEASEILDFPTSPTDSFHLNDRVVLSQRKSRFNEDFHRPEAHLKTPRITASLSIDFPEIDSGSGQPSYSSSNPSSPIPTEGFIALGVALPPPQDTEFSVQNCAFRIGPFLNADTSSGAFSRNFS
ncbi:hypothetical protein D9611_003427 [Ephemerocybe angulata]|uniref:Uncharacterized protein n=1 Tax=Ephemerocybe angulata TaxID=980116 RepID=A0A8H5CA94_9AGAR|nr:hypothetical protein D9611_003427 [Tulosesus angulatus]